MEQKMINPVVLDAELLRLEGKHGPALRALLKAVHRVAVEINKPWDNYHLIQSLSRELGCPSMLPILADLELAGIVQRNKGDIHFPWSGDRQDPEVVGLVERFLAEELHPSPEPKGFEPTELPPDLFQDITGYDDVKELLLGALKAEKPVHVLFWGVPASAKTMFLMELARLGVPYILGSQSTRAGIADMLFDLEPDLLLVDEIDRLGTKDIGILLSLAQTGIVSETKHMGHRKVTLKTKIFAASNTLRLPPELLSRFFTLQFKPYAYQEFRVVVSSVLVRQEKVDSELASHIAEKVWLMNQRDPRQAVRIARLARSKEDVDRLIAILTKYSTHPC